MASLKIFFWDIPRWKSRFELGFGSGWKHRARVRLILGFFCQNLIGGIGYPIQFSGDLFISPRIGLGMGMCWFNHSSWFHPATEIELVRLQLACGLSLQGSFSYLAPKSSSRMPTRVSVCRFREREEKRWVCLISGRFCMMFRWEHFSNIPYLASILTSPSVFNALILFLESWSCQLTLSELDASIKWWTH